MSEIVLQPGQIIDGRYVVETLIGEGGMAAVYRVRHLHLDTLHALKVLTMTSGSVRRRLMQEGRVQAALRHPNIVAVTDVVAVDGAPGLVLEYVRGPSLEQWAHERRFTIPQIDDLAVGILDGVLAAHSLDLIHRDLKPANVMLGITSETLVPKVADFGLVKLIAGDKPAGMSKTRTGTTMGTPAYMAPEQCHDAKGVDHRADLWSVGVILYELVTGRECFQANSLVRLLVSVTSGEFVPVREVAPEMPERMLAAIDAAMIVEPADRIQSIRELRALWLEGATRSARSPWSQEELREAETLGAGGVATSDLLEKSFRSDIREDLKRLTDTEKPAGTLVPSKPPEAGATAVPTDSLVQEQVASLDTYIDEPLPGGDLAPPASQQATQLAETSGPTASVASTSETVLAEPPPAPASGGGGGARALPALVVLLGLLVGTGVLGAAAAGSYLFFTAGSPPPPEPQPVDVPPPTPRPRVLEITLLRVGSFFRCPNAAGPDVRSRSSK